ncbi:DUF6531 domain-containing protein, partial [Myxococcota bacterium]
MIHRRRSVIALLAFLIGFTYLPPRAYAQWQFCEEPAGNADCAYTFQVICNIEEFDSNNDGENDRIRFWTKRQCCNGLNGNQTCTGNPNEANIGEYFIGDTFASFCDGMEGQSCYVDEVCGDGYNSGYNAIIDDGCGSRSQCTMKQGAPIDIANGIVRTQPFTDFHIRGAFGDDLHFTRIYFSQFTRNNFGTPSAGAARIYNSSIGHGWIHNYQQRLEIFNSGSIVNYFRQNGEAVRFSELSPGVFSKHASFPIELEETATGYVVTENSADFYFFDQLGHLVEIRDRYGLKATVYHLPDGRIDYIQ